MPEGQQESPRQPFRLCAVVGCLAAAAVLVGCFMPWLRVDGADAERIYAKIAAELEVRDVPAAPDEESRARQAEEMALQHSLTGLDLYAWFRSAGEARTRERGAASDEPLDRVLVLLRICLIALAAAAFLLIVYFAGQCFRRATSPLLILAFVEGLLALAMGGIYEFLFTPMHEGLEPGFGLHLLLLGGAGLLLISLFGVTRRNWWQVYAGSLLVTGGLVLFGYTWLGGKLPW